MLKFFLVAHLTYENQWGKWQTTIQTFVFLGHPNMTGTQRRIRETNFIISRTEHIDSKMSLSTILLSSEAGDIARTNDLVIEV